MQTDKNNKSRMNAVIGANSQEEIPTNVEESKDTTLGSVEVQEKKHRRFV